MNVATAVTERARPLVFERFAKLATLPWVPLVEAPTPVHRADAIADVMGHDDLWVKRDDLASRLYGGNKVRRYEFVMADALDRGAKRVLTVGGLASTQVMATSIFGKALGLPVTAVMFDQPVTDFARKAIRTDLSAGAELVYGGGYARTAWRAWRRYHRERGDFFIAPGASHPRANLGYVDAMLELAAQVEAGECPRPDVIVLPTGSSGTLAALALGAAWLKWPTEVIGVRITHRAVCNDLIVGRVVRETAKWLAARTGEARWMSLRPRWRLFHGAIGGGYGYATPEALEAIAWNRALTGVDGEVTYSAKALVGLRAIAKDPAYRGRPVLLWQTLSSVEPALAEDVDQRVPEELRWVFAGE